MIEFKLEGDWKVFTRWNWQVFAKNFIAKTMPATLEKLREEAPVKSGHLKETLAFTSEVSAGGFVVTFTDMADYFDWVVFSGAPAHDIPNSFGRGPDFGIGGPFGGKFHPGIQNPDDFPRKVWATMEATMEAALLVALRQEFL